MSIFDIIPYFYQKEEIDLLCSYFNKEETYAISNNIIIVCIKAFIKMFCGTGKSLLMRTSPINFYQNLVVYVFPSLQLIEQFNSNYILPFDLLKFKQKIIRICSDNDDLSTTHLPTIETFLKLKSYKIILVTYQSFHTLCDALTSTNTRINVAHFDEAHHSVEPAYQNNIFYNNFCDKQIFYTATPRNEHGIVMYDPLNSQNSMCGNLVYDYNYFRGVNDGFLNSFDINIDFFSDNNNNSIYESIIRAAFSTSNNRILCFHSDVNTDRDTSVINFADFHKFMNAFRFVNSTEFYGIMKFNQIHIIPFHSNIPMKCSICKSKLYSISNIRCCRFNILNDFDRTPDDQLFIICSCNTIGEGVDTKHANMVTFVDPKSSIIAILQNIGRIVRKLFGVDKPKATILLPCWVDKEKYLNICNDPLERDAMIRNDLNSGGNFSSILNVLAALRQEDDELYNMCLEFDRVPTNTELNGNYFSQNCHLGDPIDLYDALIYSNLKVNDHDLDLETVATNNDAIIEIHSSNFDEEVEIYGNIKADKHVRLLNLNCGDDDDLYQPIIYNENSEKKKTY